MPAQGDEVGRLRHLHDEYAWHVNAAIEEGREDLVWRLADDYLDAAMRLMAGNYGDACQRPDCAACARPRPPQRLGWWRRAIRAVKARQPAR